MIKLTRSALTMLLAHYRSIFRQAYVKGLAAVAGASVATAGAVRAETNSTIIISPGLHYNTSGLKFELPGEYSISTSGSSVSIVDPSGISHTIVTSDMLSSNYSDPDNDPAVPGAALYLIYNPEDGDLTVNITDTDFSKNRVENTIKGYGGAMAVDYTAVLNVRGGSFAENTVISHSDYGYAEIHGGAVSLDEDVTAAFSGTAFEGNKLMLVGSTIPIDQRARGGAIANSGKLTLNNVTFRDNVTLDEGGALSLTNVNKQHTVINGGLFENNQARYGGAVFQAGYDGNSFGSGGDLTIKGTSFIGNTALTDNPEFTITPQYRWGYGGAIAQADFHPQKLSIADADFSSNMATYRGGAVYFNAPNSSTSALVNHDQEIRNSIFSGNQAAAGGALYVNSINSGVGHEYANVLISDSTFTGNAAIAIDPADTRYKAENAEENGQGGAIYINEWARVSFTGRNTFENNQAGSKGNDIYNAQGKVFFIGGETRLGSGLTNQRGTVEVKENALASIALAENLSEGTIVVGGTASIDSFVNKGEISVTDGVLTLGTNLTPGTSPIPRNPHVAYIHITTQAGSSATVQGTGNLDLTNQFVEAELTGASQFNFTAVGSLKLGNEAFKGDGNGTVRISAANISFGGWNKIEGIAKTIFEVTGTADLTGGTFGKTNGNDDLDGAYIALRNGTFKLNQLGMLTAKLYNGTLNDASISLKDADVVTTNLVLNSQFNDNSSVILFAEKDNAASSVSARLVRIAADSNIGAADKPLTGVSIRTDSLHGALASNQAPTLSTGDFSVTGSQAASYSGHIKLAGASLSMDRAAVLDRGAASTAEGSLNGYLWSVQAGDGITAASGTLKLSGWTGTAAFDEVQAFKAANFGSLGGAVLSLDGLCVSAAKKDGSAVTLAEVLNAGVAVSDAVAAAADTAVDEYTRNVVLTASSSTGGIDLSGVTAGAEGVSLVPGTTTELTGSVGATGNLVNARDNSPGHVLLNDSSVLRALSSGAVGKITTAAPVAGKLELTGGSTGSRLKAASVGTSDRPLQSVAVEEKSVLTIAGGMYIGREGAAAAGGGDDPAVPLYGEITGRGRITAGNVDVQQSNVADITIASDAISLQDITGKGNYTETTAGEGMLIFGGNVETGSIAMGSVKTTGSSVLSAATAKIGRLAAGGDLSLVDSELNGNSVVNVQELNLNGYRLLVDPSVLTIGGFREDENHLASGETRELNGSLVAGSGSGVLIGTPTNEWLINLNAAGNALADPADPALLYINADTDLNGYSVTVNNALTNANIDAHLDPGAGTLAVENGRTVIYDAVVEADVLNMIPKNAAGGVPGLINAGSSTLTFDGDNPGLRADNLLLGSHDGDDISQLGGAIDVETGTSAVIQTGGLQLGDTEGGASAGEDAKASLVIAPNAALKLIYLGRGDSLTLAGNAEPYRNLHVNNQGEAVLAGNLKISDAVLNLFTHNAGSTLSLKDLVLEQADTTALLSNLVAAGSVTLDGVTVEHAVLTAQPSAGSSTAAVTALDEADFTDIGGVSAAPSYNTLNTTATSLTISTELQVNDSLDLPSDGTVNLVKGITTLGDLDGSFSFANSTKLTIASGATLVVNDPLLNTAGLASVTAAAGSRLDVTYENSLSTTGDLTLNGTLVAAGTEVGTDNTITAGNSVNTGVLSLDGGVIIGSDADKAAAKALTFADVEIRSGVSSDNGTGYLNTMLKLGPHTAFDIADKSVLRLINRGRATPLRGSIDNAGTFMLEGGYTLAQDFINTAAAADGRRLGTLMIGDDAGEGDWKEETTLAVSGTSALTIDGGRDLILSNDSRTEIKNSRGLTTLTADYIQLSGDLSLGSGYEGSRTARDTSVVTDLGEYGRSALYIDDAVDDPRIVFNTQDSVLNMYNTAVSTVLNEDGTVAVTPVTVTDLARVDFDMGDNASDAVTADGDVAAPHYGTVNLYGYFRVADSAGSAAAGVDALGRAELQGIYNRSGSVLTLDTRRNNTVTLDAGETFVSEAGATVNLTNPDGYAATVTADNLVIGGTVNVGTALAGSDAVLGTDDRNTLEIQNGTVINVANGASSLYLYNEAVGDEGAYVRVADLSHAGIDNHGTVMLEGNFKASQAQLSTDGSESSLLTDGTVTVRSNHQVDESYQVSTLTVDGKVDLTGVNAASLTVENFARLKVTSLNLPENFAGRTGIFDTDVLTSATDTVNMNLGSVLGIGERLLKINRSLDIKQLNIASSAAGNYSLVMLGNVAGSATNITVGVNGGSKGYLIVSGDVTELDDVFINNGTINHPALTAKAGSLSASRFTFNGLNNADEYVCLNALTINGTSDTNRVDLFGTSADIFDVSTVAAHIFNNEGVDADMAFLTADKLISNGDTAATSISDVLTAGTVEIQNGTVVVGDRVNAGESSISGKLSVTGGRLQIENGEGVNAGTATLLLKEPDAVALTEWRSRLSVNQAQVVKTADGVYSAAGYTEGEVKGFVTDAINVFAPGSELALAGFGDTALNDAQLKQIVAAIDSDATTIGGFISTDSSYGVFKDGDAVDVTTADDVLLRTDWYENVTLANFDGLTAVDARTYDVGAIKLAGDTRLNIGTGAVILHNATENGFVVNNADALADISFSGKGAFITYGDGAVGQITAANDGIGKVAVYDGTVNIESLGSEAAALDEVYFLNARASVAAAQGGIYADDVYIWKNSDVSVGGRILADDTGGVYVKNAAATVTGDIQAGEISIVKSTVTGGENLESHANAVNTQDIVIDESTVNIARNIESADLLDIRNSSVVTSQRVTTEGSLSVVRSTLTTSTLTTNGAMSIDGSSKVTVALKEGVDDAGDASINFVGVSTVKGGSVLSVENELKLGNGVILAIGDADSAGATLIAKQVNLNAGYLFLDPQTTSDPSTATVQIWGDDATRNNINGIVEAGHYSGVYNGDSMSQAEFKKYVTAAISNGYNSVYYADKAVTVNYGSGHLWVTNETQAGNTAEIGVDDEVYVANGSLLVVSAKALGDPDENANYAHGGISSSGSNVGHVQIDGAVLLKDIDLANSAQVNVFNGFNAVHFGDTGEYIIKNAMFSASQHEPGSGIADVSYDTVKADAALAGVDNRIANTIRSALSTGTVLKNSSFLGQVTSQLTDMNGNGNTGAIAQTLNSASRIAVLGGATQNVQLAQRVFIEAVEERQGFLAKHSSSIGDVKGTDVTVWVTPMYAAMDSEDWSGGKSGDLGADSKLWGVAVGGDAAMENGLSFGAAFQGGSGTSHSNGRFNSTDGDFDFFGMSLYAAYEFKGFKVLGDITYTLAKNDIDQSSPIGKLSTSMDSKLLSIGLNGKYDFKLESGVVITPHLGVRFNQLEVDSYNVKGRGFDKFHGKDFDASYVTIPVGVGFSKDFRTKNGWTMKPAIDFSIVSVVGDKEVKTPIVTNGLTLDGKSDISEGVYFRGRLGFDAQYKNFGLGIGYGYYGAKGTCSHNLSITARYSF